MNGDSMNRKGKGEAARCQQVRGGAGKKEWGQRNNKRLHICYFRSFAEQNSMPEKGKRFYGARGSSVEKSTARRGICFPLEPAALPPF
jgi:hypothetical protein